MPQTNYLPEEELDPKSAPDAPDAQPGPDVSVAPDVQPAPDAQPGPEVSVAPDPADVYVVVHDAIGSVASVGPFYKGELITPAHFGVYPHVLNRWLEVGAVRPATSEDCAGKGIAAPAKHDHGYVPTVIKTDEFGMPDVVASI